ncbi:MAG: ATP-binding cassette domain-containing protein [Clostridiales bacterium]|uniref:ATP-binding cassette domain-containing protein n=1 Tax=Flavonifractor porci TaxID=3133422 RepID=UPI0030994A3F|nr:ATP-binding cassette domain-containing protein [Clostridiales bacterium]
MTDTFVIQNLCFAYPEQSGAILRELNLTIRRGEFLVLCGPSGCGKSTLLRQLKTVLAPHGRRSGTILFEGRPLDALDQRQQTERIGFVQQSPDNQIVTDKVWHELAFGLESLGYETPVIRQRVAEMAAFFGIESWFYKNVTELSGGQKQLLNLASVMAMQPSVLILDEPTSQLDPIAAADFLATLGRINRELGTTILLTEHRLEDAFPLATRVAVMEEGRLLCSGTPAEVGDALRACGHTMFLAMPAAMRVWAAVEDGGACPVTVREGRNWLTDYGAKHPLCPLPPEPARIYPEEPVLKAEELWFKYEKDGPDVVRGLSLALKKGEFYALLGGNGAGKSTSLKLLGGLLKPYRGTVSVRGTVGVLPQNPQTLFVKKTVREDLAEILEGNNAKQEERIAHVAALCRLKGLLDHHPYDLSGGEQQRAALAKILLLDPDILLMDEPTKGLDAEFKQVFAEILQVLLRRGVTVLMVSHDIGFCARYAHRCALFFDGGTVSEGTPRAFFSGNSFYTTSSNRMARELEPGAITPEDVIILCGGHLPPVPELPDDIPILPEPEKGSAAEKPEKLPWWRKILATLSAGIALILFFSFMGVADLTTLVTAEGLTSLAGEQLLLYFIFCSALLIFALCVTRRSHLPDYLRQTPKEQRKLTRRTLAAMILIVLLIPVTLFVGITYLGGKKYYFISLLILLETMLPFFLIFEGRKPQARELVTIAVLCAVGVAGRAFFFMLPQFKPVMAVTIIAGIAFGGEAGFLVGSMTMLASNVMFGQSPLTPWQMFAMGIIGFLAGILFRKGLLMRTREALCIFGALCAILVYGGIMNGASALTANRELTGGILLSSYVVGMPFDCIHAMATWLFLWFGAEPMLEKLDRIKVKYGLVS